MKILYIVTYITHTWPNTLFPIVTYKFTIDQKREAANQNTSMIYVIS